MGRRYLLNKKNTRKSYKSDVVFSLNFFFDCFETGIHDDGDCNTFAHIIHRGRKPTVQ